MLLHYIRGWDSRSANGVDHLIANSHFIARRIRKAYQRDATVIYPAGRRALVPVRATKDDFYLTASRMVPYKRIDLIVKAFSKTPERRLVVIGDGPEMAEDPGAGRAERRDHGLSAVRGACAITCSARARSYSLPKRTSASRSWKRRRAARR